MTCGRGHVFMANGTALAALLALEAFVQEHRHCGELDGEVEADRVWMTCRCGAAINRALENVA